MSLLNIRDLTDVQWILLDALIPEPPRRKDGRGRPWKGRRNVLNGILWVLRTGAPWADLPERYPSYQTCHRRFQQWVRSGIMRGVLEALAEDLRIQGRLDVREAFIDGSFAPAKKGSKVGKTKRGKGTKIMAVADRHGLPVAIFVESATPHEVKLAESTLLQMVIPEPPQNLIGDNAYDSDKLDTRLRSYGIELISPHRSNRKNRTQDLRRLRRYRRRWKIGVSRQGHINQSVKVRPRLRDSSLVAGEASRSKSETMRPSDNILRKECAQLTRLQRTVNAEVASLHVNPEAETLDNVRKQQELTETSPMRRLSPAGYQRRHGGKENVSTGEALGARRRKLAEEVSTITVSGKCRHRYQGDGSGRNTVDGRAAKRARRKGPGPVSTPLATVRQG